MAQLERGYFEKPQDAESAELDILLAPESCEISTELCWHYLQQKALQGFFANRKYLQEKGYLRLRPDGQPMSDEDLMARVESFFAPVREIDRVSGNLDVLYKSEAYRDLVEQLAYAGVVVPCVADDWEVDRGVERIAELQGQKNPYVLERTWAQRYPGRKRKTLSLGPGNGREVYEQERYNRLLPESQRFQQFGIGSEILHPTEGVFKNVLKEGVLRYSNVELAFNLSNSALRREMKPRWFDAPTSNVRDWVPKEKVFDLNIAYELLRHAKSWLPRYFDQQKRTFTLSGEFENQITTKLEGFVFDFFVALANSEELYLEKLFQEDFVKGVLDPAYGARPNLNRYPEVYLRNIVVADFQEIPDFFPPGSISIVRGHKSLTHPSNTAYQKIISKLPDILEPDGVIVTDGVKQSYTRFLRFEQIRKAARRHKLRAEFAVHGNSKELLGDLIQKPGPGGFLTDEDKGEIYKPEIAIQDLGDVGSRLDLVISNLATERIMGGSENPECFRHIHERVRARIAELLLISKAKEVVEKHFRQEIINQAFTDEFWRREVLSIVADGKIDLPDSVIQEIVDAVCQDVSEIVRPSWIIQNPEEVLRKPKRNKFYTLSLKEPEPQPEGANNLLNHCYEIDVKRFPDNDFLNTREMREYTEERRQYLLQMLEKMLKKKKFPIAIQEFTDCMTNLLLRYKLIKILGEKVTDYVTRLPISFSPAAGFYKLTDDADSHFERCLKDVAIRMGGGSMHDLYSLKYHQLKGEGSKDRNDYAVQGERLLLNGPYAFDICFSSQVMANVVGKQAGSISGNYPGMLEFGPTPTDILAEGRKHPWLRKFPTQVTFATTHSGHVYVARGDKHLITPLAVSATTGLPLAWETKYGLGTLIHPEVDLVKDGKVAPEVGQLLGSFKKKAKASFDERFHGGFDVAAQNFDKVINEKTGKPRVKANAGDLLLIEGLIYLAEKFLSEGPANERGRRGA